MKLPVNYHKTHYTIRRLVREEYIERQDGKCYLCGEPLSNDPREDILNSPINWKLFPLNFLRYPIHLHHSHESGDTIGAVHAYCNAYLWQYLSE